MRRLAKGAVILLSVSAVTHAQAVITRAEYESTEHLVVRSKHSEWWHDAAGVGTRAGGWHRPMA